MKNSAQQLENMFYGATFDDFLFRPQHSVAKTRRDIDLTMPLSRRIKINAPIVGANMDTVTGREMMKTLSLEGAFGFLDRNCSIAEEAARVKYVKSQHSFVIEDPLIMSSDVLIKDAKEIINKYRISGILVEKSEGSRILAGILSHRDFPTNGYGKDDKVSKYMTPFKKLVTAKKGIKMEEAEKLMFEKRVEKLPIIDAKGRIKGLITMRDLKLAKQKPHSSKDKKGRLLVGATIGARGDYLERAEAVINAGADCILMDIAHADSDLIKTAIKNFKSRFKGVELICGNVATAEGSMFLADLGVDAIKVGVGPGRGCRTRLETGAGVPQLQAIREAYLAIGNKIPIIADGGIRNDKDIFLAIAAGASTVMLGSFLSGTDETPGMVIEDPATKQKFKFYRGMTSPEAVVEGSEGEAGDILDTPAEGQSLKIPYVGSVIGIINRVKGHLQSSVSYAGELSLSDTHKKITKNPEEFLIRLSEASRKESFDR